ncbi:hypothetical protein HMI54_008287 [Coelomomyces lativittatus]|nr:hypothetical protein HMI56_004374 [Coelomomyces lativittatus]KAJ1512877.1 hypothetical protein HMI55_006070 [Coelomomyces lativittatus]KAJ1516768.1 hypothetical protein HMI54_008287 [Coelomomyces lativittatus]
MDYQNRVGSKPGSGGVAGWSESNVDRRERLRKLALETIDLAKDPYILKNHLGSYECKLCLTLHTNEGSYLAHTQGKKHQANLARRAARDAKESSFTSLTSSSSSNGGLMNTSLSSSNLNKHPSMMVFPKKQFVKIGRPGYHVQKVKDPTTSQIGFLFKIDYPLLNTTTTSTTSSSEPHLSSNTSTSSLLKPRHRFMGAYEQKVEPPNRLLQYLVFAAEPYETIAFRIPSKEVDMGEGKFFTYWDKEQKQFYLQMLYKSTYFF